MTEVGSISTVDFAFCFVVVVFSLVANVAAVIVVGPSLASDGFVVSGGSTASAIVVIIGLAVGLVMEITLVKLDFAISVVSITVVSEMVGSFVVFDVDITGDFTVVIGLIGVGLVVVFFVSKGRVPLSCSTGS